MPQILLLLQVSLIYWLLAFSAVKNLIMLNFYKDTICSSTFKIDLLCLVMMLSQPKFAEDINKCKANEGATFA